MMHTLYPLTFDLSELTRDYLWGGSKLKRLVPNYPADQPLSELWVVSDRPEEDRVGTIANGPLIGTTLRELMDTRPTDLLGDVAAVDGKFPLLVKFLDAQSRLSLQVHPPEGKVANLGGEPKTECWTFLDGTESDAKLFVGLKSGVSRATFEQILQRGGDLGPLLHTIHPKAADCLFIPSGRLHGLGAGSLVYEVQQNSNTTYRVFDWNRVDARTGQPRDLHSKEALASINFSEPQPSLQHPEQQGDHQTLVNCPYFTLERWVIDSARSFRPNHSFDIITALAGEVVIEDGGQSLVLHRFGTALIPASVEEYRLKPVGQTQLLRTFVRP